MLYYKARNDAYDYFNKFAVIKDELLTKRERETKARYISDSNFDIVRINKNNTFKIFGIRKEVKP